MKHLGPCLAGLCSLGLIVATAAAAGSGPSGCDDLGSIAETPGVDYRTRIQPILDGCASCHDESGPAGLDLRDGESYDNLVGVVSTTNASRLRVAPSDPGASALFLAVNCDSPDGPGFRMPGTTLSEQALIRDWIAQGALPEPVGAGQAVVVPVDGPWALVSLVVVLWLTAAGRRRIATSRFGA